MSNSGLFEISEKAFRRIDKEKICDNITYVTDDSFDEKEFVTNALEKNQKLEKEVLKIIKIHSPFIDDDGIVEISYNQKRGEYFILDNIINSHMQRYFEEKYSLYYVDKKYVPYDNGYGNYYKLTFIWNSVEYYIKNMSKTKIR